MPGPTTEMSSRGQHPPPPTRSTYGADDYRATAHVELVPSLLEQRQLALAYSAAMQPQNGFYPSPYTTLPGVGAEATPFPHPPRPPCYPPPIPADRPRLQDSHPGPSLSPVPEGAHQSSEEAGAFTFDVTQPVRDLIQSLAPCAGWSRWWPARPLTVLFHVALAIPSYLLMVVPALFFLVCRAALQSLHMIDSTAKHPIPSRRRRPAALHGRTQGPTPSVFVDGSGWAYPWSLGACNHLQKEYHTEGWEVFALSAGNIGGLCLALGLDIESEVRVRVGSLRDQVLYSHLEQPLCMYCSSLGPVRDLLEEMLPADAHQRLSGRYHAVTAAWPYLGFRFVSEFTSKRHLIDSVVASMALPFFVYRPILVWRQAFYGGVWPELLIDGGIQSVLTPVDLLCDFSIRTFPDPLRRNIGTTLLPPDHLQPGPKNAIVPPTTEEVLQKVHETDSWFRNSGCEELAYNMRHLEAFRRSKKYEYNV